MFRRPLLPLPLMLIEKEKGKGRKEARFKAKRSAASFLAPLSVLVFPQKSDGKNISSDAGGRRGRKRGRSQSGRPISQII